MMLQMVRNGNWRDEFWFLASILLILAIVAGIWVRVVSAPVMGPGRLIFYALLLLAIAILAVDITQHQDPELGE
jgi:hypothetical protein